MRIPLTSYGRREILLGTLLCFALMGGALLFSPLMIILPAALWLFLMAFFRDPDRPCAAHANELLSPADGTVADIEEMDAPDYLDGRVLRIGVFMSVLNVHVNRSPVGGTVEFVKHVPGKFYDARTEASKLQNEHCLLGIKARDGKRILVNQVAGIIARRIVCKAQVGHVLRPGERFGMVKFGSRLELYVPIADNPVPAVSVGDRVKAGRDVLARYGSP